MMVKNSFENYVPVTGALNSRGSSVAVGAASKDEHEDENSNNHKYQIQLHCIWILLSSLPPHHIMEKALIIW